MIRTFISRGGSRIFGKGGGVIQGTKPLGGDVLQRVKHAGARPGGMPPPRKIFFK